jgi:OOP family OmpA-OmpF porin
MNDGAEISAKKNPMDSSDDLFDLSKGKKIVLRGVTFETNKSQIKPESKVILEKVRESMAANPEVTVIITGHTDNVGSDEYNRGLSQERAQAVKDWLVKNNISASRMKVIGKGETQPAATNDTKEGRAENRRIEFLVE